MQVLRTSVTHAILAILVGLVWSALPACGDNGTGSGSPDASLDAASTNDAQTNSDAGDGAFVDAARDAETTGDAQTDAQVDGGIPSNHFIVVTFNTGTSSGMQVDGDGDNYGSAQADLEDEYYGNGLAWGEAVDRVKTWLIALQPEVVAFQEIFYSGECPSIPASAYPGFVCETWQAGNPTVSQVLVGAGYQVACHPGKPDKCIAVKKSFGTIQQCNDPDFCLEGLDGEHINDCGGGARVARATIDLVAGGQITVVNIHGTSGVKRDDMDCRVAQVDQIFEDMDGEPGANGTRNVIMGDFNIDPGRIPGFLDPSSAEWNKYVGRNQPFQWVSPYGPSAEPTYDGKFNIDNVVSDAFTGTCYTPGVTSGHPDIYPYHLFDHKPLVCELGDL